MNDNRNAAADLQERINSDQDLLQMLDALLRKPEPFWNRFYQDRTKPIPFFTDAPDENVTEYVRSGRLTGGTAVEFGCGNGRNAIYLAKSGYKVKALDISSEAIRWAEEQSRQAGVDVEWECRSVYDLELEPHSADLVYDSGCMHHLPPHRRFGYVKLIKETVKPGGYFGMVCFAPGFEEQGGAGLRTDWAVYRVQSMQGGMAFTKERLVDMFGDCFEVVEMRLMKAQEPGSGTFGVSFLWTVLFQKRSSEV